MFIEKYVKYVKEQTDAPTIYQVAMAYFVASSVVTKNCWVPFGHKKLYPNIYLLIVGPSTLHRKSWSRGIGIDLIDEVMPDILIQDTSSRENFIQIMADEERTPSNTAMLSIDELKGFMDRTRKGQHHQGFIQDLSQLYDGGRFKRSRGVDKMEHFDMREPFLNLVACCSNEWLADSIEKSDVSGGFLARFIWAIDNSVVKEASPWPKASQNEDRSHLIRDLQGIGSVLGEFNPDPEAWAFWESWYKRFRMENQGGFWDANYERLTILGMKLSLLKAIMRVWYEMAEGKQPAHTITTQDMKDAVLFIEGSALAFKDIVISADEEEKVTHKILQAIKKSPQGLAHADIYRKVFGLKASMLTKCIATLLDAGCVELETGLGKLKIYAFKQDLT